MYWRKNLQEINERGKDNYIIIINLMCQCKKEGKLWIKDSYTSSSFCDKNVPTLCFSSCNFYSLNDLRHKILFTANWACNHRIHFFIYQVRTLKTKVMQWTADWKYEFFLKKCHTGSFPNLFKGCVRNRSNTGAKFNTSLIRGEKVWLCGCVQEYKKWRIWDKLLV